MEEYEGYISFHSLYWLTVFSARLSFTLYIIRDQHTSSEYCHRSRLILNSEIMSNDSNDGEVLLSSGNNIESTENTSLGCRPCDPLKILKFVECLSATTNSIEMQILVNKYVSTQEQV